MESLNVVDVIKNARYFRDSYDTIRYNATISTYIRTAYSAYREYYQSRQLKADWAYMAINTILVSIMNADGCAFYEEYGVYYEIFNSMGRKTYSREEIERSHHQVTKEDAIKMANSLRDARYYVSDTQYYYLVLGLCMFAYLGERSMDSNEYNVIKALLDSSYDYVPSTLAEVNKEL
jgi:hypothetical protein